MSIRAFQSCGTGCGHRLARFAMACRRVGGKLGRDTRGATAVEYGLVVALVVIAVMFAIAGLGQANYDVWSNVAAKVTAAR